MTEQIKPLSLTEVAYLDLIGRLKRDAEAQAHAAYNAGFAVLCRQHAIPDGVRVNIEPAVGPVPARLVYDDGATPEGDSA